MIIHITRNELKLHLTVIYVCFNAQTLDRMYFLIMKLTVLKSEILKKSSSLLDP